jgi:Fic family protein
MCHSPPVQTLRDIDQKLGLVPAGIVTQLGRIDAAQGREQLFTRRAPAVLDRLVQVARVQSAEASNAIEGVVAPSARIKELMAETTEPQNRSEAEIAGYRSVLDMLHRSAPDMPVTSGVVLQMHRDLYRFTGSPGGRWKSVENHIEERNPDGTRTVVFTTLPAFETPAAMDRLNDLARAHLAAGRHHRLLVTGAYALDFLCIHPFLDGNGRMARLLTLQLLYRGGYGVGRYISIEKAIEETRETYYDALRASSAGWHDRRHDPWPWLEYFLGIMVAVYARFEERVDTFAGRGAKTEAIERFVAGLPAGQTFRVGQVREVAGGASDSHISKVLARLREQGAIEPRGRGRGAHWIRAGG